MELNKAQVPQEDATLTAVEVLPAAASASMPLPQHAAPLWTMRAIAAATNASDEDNMSLSIQWDALGSEGVSRGKGC